METNGTTNEFLVVAVNLGKKVLVIFDLVILLLRLGKGLGRVSGMIYPPKLPK